MQHTLFCYGTLMVPEIISRVTERTIAPGIPATLSDFGCFKVRHETFPGVRQSAGEMTQGRLYPQLTATDIHLLDTYEGHLYSREKVTVSTESSNHFAWCYLIKPEYFNELLTERWCYQHFLNTDLASFNRQ